MNKTTWSVETKKIFNGILLFSLAWIAYGIFDPIESLVSGFDTMSSVASAFSGTTLPSSGAAGTILSIVTYLLLAGIGFGCILTIKGLGNFSKMLDAPDAKAIGTLRTGFIIALIGVALNILPFIPDIVGDILYLVAVILMLVGYNGLKGSASFAGQNGASILFIAMILILVGWVLDFIPFIGDWIDALLTVIAYIMTLVGWSKIKNSVPA
jgi:hypothetical protein